MPLLLDTPRVSARDTIADTIEIACLNNLGDAGLESGERQIVDLLTATAGARTVRLRFFSLPCIDRGPRARSRLSEHYTDFADLMQSRVDGLIVTGCEPRAASLPDEPFWRGLTEVIDWAEHNTKSTIWSCLAAHAAVLHLDGVHRRRLPEKCSGVFPVERCRDHPLLAGVRGHPVVPHSRHNDLGEPDLVAAGYDVLTRSPAIGVDAFVKQWRSLFVYLQGHPEYDPDALHREYRRDVTRYLEGLSTAYPVLPHGYYDEDGERAMKAFEMRALQQRDPGLVLSFPDGAGRRPWRRSFPRTLIQNWLTHLEHTANGRPIDA